MDIDYTPSEDDEATTAADALYMMSQVERKPARVKNQSVSKRRMEEPPPLPRAPLLSKDAFWRGIRREVVRGVSSVTSEEMLYALFGELYDRYLVMDSDIPTSFREMNQLTIGSRNMRPTIIFRIMRDHLLKKEAEQPVPQPQIRMRIVKPVKKIVPPTHPLLTKYNHLYRDLSSPAIEDGLTHAMQWQDDPATFMAWHSTCIQKRASFLEDTLPNYLERHWNHLLTRLKTFRDSRCMPLLTRNRHLQGMLALLKAFDQVRDDLSDALLLDWSGLLLGERYMTLGSKEKPLHTYYEIMNPFYFDRHIEPLLRIDHLIQREGFLCQLVICDDNGPVAQFNSPLQAYRKAGRQVDRSDACYMYLQLVPCTELDTADVHSSPTKKQKRTTRSSPM
jgi:hypothetical protein